MGCTGWLATFSSHLAHSAAVIAYTRSSEFLHTMCPCHMCMHVHARSVLTSRLVLWLWQSVSQSTAGWGCSHMCVSEAAALLIPDTKEHSRMTCVLFGVCLCSECSWLEMS
jgi:hypothetical protein